MKKKIPSRKFLPTLAAVILIAIIAAPVLASPATAIRTLPTSVESGADFDVAIEASDCGFAGQVVETLPDGFAYLSHTPSDIGIEQVGNTVKFTFLGDSVSFTYTVRAPTVATTTTYAFKGIVRDENNVGYPIPDSDITVTAPGSVTHTLTMAVSGNGSITPSVGSHIYETDTIVDISAIPDSGWRFDRWSNNVAEPNSSSTTVTMDGDKTVTAYFTRVSGTRTLPALVPSGAEFDVTIEASGCGTFGQVTETLPSGFAYVSSSLPEDQVEQIGNIVKFSYFNSASFTYRVKAPRVAESVTYTFQGVVLDEDRISYPIEDDEIEVSVTSGTRVLPSSVTSGAKFIVDIEVSGCGDLGQVVETLPGEFSYLSSSLPEDQVEQIGNTVKFSFFDSASFTYRVKAPRVAESTTYIFHGRVLDEDRISYPIEDDDIKVINRPPVANAGIDQTVYASPPTTTAEVMLDGSDSYDPDGDALTHEWTWDDNAATEANPKIELPPGITTITLVVNDGNLDSPPDTMNITVLESKKPYVLPRQRAKFSASYLHISPEQVLPNQQVEISINIGNRGGKRGSHTAVLYINGQLENSRTVGVSPGSCQNVVFRVSKATPGIYQVSLEGQQGQFTVIAPPTTTYFSGSLGTGGIITIAVVALALIAALVFLVARTRRE